MMKRLQSIEKADESSKSAKSNNSNEMDGGNCMVKCCLF